MNEREKIGVIITGSLHEGLTARLDPEASVETMRVGNFVIVEGQKKRFFSLITDVTLGATNEEVLQDPPTDLEPLIGQVLAGTSTFGTVQITPMLMLEKEETRLTLEEGDRGLRPVRTVPSHFSPVYLANEEDFHLVFGEEKPGGKEFEIGRPLDMEVPVCINLDRFVERSNGLFGKSGTGKSFLARLLLSGIIKANAAVNFVFDMHSEYGWDARTEDQSRPFAKGLRQLFPSKVRVFSADPASSRRRGVAVDGEVTIGLDEIEVEDIILLQEELNLTATAAESAYQLYDRYGKNWMQTLHEMSGEEIKDFTEQTGGHAGAISALKRKLDQVHRLAFIRPTAQTQALQQMIDCIERGDHVILEFGRENSPLAYMLVANIITRRIHRLYVEKTELYNQTKDPAHKPKQLMITIEEAHKFLNPVAARQTIFGTIAREMRKYFVTLMVIDQRPSSIDTEVLSQIGTRVTALLNDEKDIEAVFTGVSGAANLKAILASLDPREQAMILGYAVPMPATVRTRKYDEAFYKAMGFVEPADRHQQAEKDKADLFGD